MIEVSFLLFYYCERKISFINFEHMKFSRFLLILVKLTWLKRTHDQSLLRVTSKLWEKCSVKKVQARASLVGQTKLALLSASPGRLALLWNLKYFVHDDYKDSDSGIFRSWWGWKWCWWHPDGRDFKLMTEFRYWRQLLNVVTRRRRKRILVIKMTKLSHTS